MCSFRLCPHNQRVFPTPLHSMPCSHQISKLHQYCIFLRAGLISGDYSTHSMLACTWRHPKWPCSHQISKLHLQHYTTSQCTPTPHCKWREESISNDVLLLRRIEPIGLLLSHHVWFGKICSPSVSMYVAMSILCAEQQQTVPLHSPPLEEVNSSSLQDSPATSIIVHRDSNHTVAAMLSCCPL